MAENMILKKNANGLNYAMHDVIFVNSRGTLHY